MIAEETSAAKLDVAATLKDYGKQPVVPIEGLTFTEEQVLRNWFPDEPRREETRAAGRWTGDFLEYGQRAPAGRAGARKGDPDFVRRKPSAGMRPS